MGPSDARRVAGTGAGFEELVFPPVTRKTRVQFPAAEFPRKFGFVIAAGGCNTRGGGSNPHFPLVFHWRSNRKNLMGAP